jgi:hypothetical protein
MTGAAGQMGQNEASNIYGAAQARASGYIGQGNALNQALGQVAGIAGQLPMQNAMMDYYRNNTPSDTGTGSGGTGTGPGGTFEPGFGVRKPKSKWGF